MENNPKIEELIYSLIFSEESDFNIDISEYIDDIYEYRSFVSNMKSILKKSGVNIIESDVEINSITAMWILKVSK